MAEPFLAELRIMSFNFAPKGWATCDGQLMPINQNQALFSLLGTTYGGDGRVNFALPNLKGRTPIHRGGNSSRNLGEAFGEPAHTLTLNEMPQHFHPVNTNVDKAPASGGNQPANNKRLAGNEPGFLYSAPSQFLPMAPNAVGNSGGSQPHENRQPLLVLNFCIALQGIFPSQN
jgi:microcystin-dependent protein